MKVGHQKDARFAGWLDVLTLWLNTHFAGLPAVALCGPFHDESLTEALKHFGEPYTVSILFSDYVIVRVDTADEAGRLCQGMLKEVCFSVSWDGTKITGENT